MKKILPIVLILMLALVGCNTTPEAASSASTKPSATAAPSASATQAPDPVIDTTPTTEQESRFNIEDITVTAGSQSVVALRKSNWASTYHNGGMLSADSFPYQHLAATAPNCPVINGKDFTLSAVKAAFAEGKLYKITGEDFVQTASFRALDGLYTQISDMSGEYLVCLDYIYQGKYIESLNENECACYTYFFRLVI